MTRTVTRTTPATVRAAFSLTGLGKEKSSRIRVSVYSTGSVLFWGGAGPVRPAAPPHRHDIVNPMVHPVCQRIGHGGASALAPANTHASFDAALDVGVDMVEFDVRAHRGELVLAHTLLDARLPGRVRLADALDHLSSRRFEGIEL